MIRISSLYVLVSSSLSGLAIYIYIYGKQVINVMIRNKTNYCNYEINKRYIIIYHVAIDVGMKELRKKRMRSNFSAK